MRAASSTMGIADCTWMRRVFLVHVSVTIIVS